MIKKICTKLTALLLIVNMMLISPAGLVVAEEISSDNTSTGSGSDNTAATTTDQTNDTTNTNDATVDNTTVGGATSGDNTATENTGSGTIDTSNATTTSTTDTTVNTNTVTASPAPSYAPMSWTTWTGEGDWASQNQNTGSSSTNTATTTGTETNNLTNNNTADINNNSDIGSTTGSNTASDNTGDASINTGNATTTSSTNNVANLNYWTGQGDWTNLWNGEALNYLTGANSDNEATTEITELINILNENGVDISNLIGANASSGANIASDNTGNASISTGNASLLSTLFNMANTNIFGTEAVNILYQDVYGNYSGNIDLSSASPYSLFNLAQNPLTLTSSNDTTGFNSDNTAGVNGSLTFDILNNNDGNLLNDLNLESITGNNTASDNTGDATIETGDADIIANLINMLNTNIITSQFYFGVVNVYGNWLGNLILPEYPSSSSYSGNLASSASNSFTGSTSDNTADTNISQDLTQTNDNTAAVNNNLNLTTDSGGNSAAKNTGSGFVDSGDTSGEANLANWVNTNIVSDSPWWLVMINNLGSWIPVLSNPATGTQIVLDLDSLGLSGSTGSSATANAENDHTGSSSTNSASTDLTIDGTITNQNTGTITNNVDGLALTGGNNADRNTGNGSVTTGDASIWLNVLNFLNTNISAPSVMLTIVNIFGSWTGDVLNYGTSTQVADNTTSPPAGGTAQNSNSSNSGGGSSSDSNSTPASNSSGTGSTGDGSVVTKYSYQSTSNSAGGQVLSFSEDKSDQGNAQGTGVNSQFNSFILVLTLGLVLFMLMGISIWQRRRVVRFLRTTRINLF